MLPDNFFCYTGEFTRCYGKNELNNVIAKYGMVYTCSFVIGPCTPLLLQWIHYNKWPIILDQSNCIGILLMLIQTIFAICVYFGFSNLSDEPGYALFVEEEQEIHKKNNEKILKLMDGDQICGINTDNDEKVELIDSKKSKQEILTIREMITQFDLMLVIFSSAYSTFLSGIIDLQINMVCLYALKWTLTDISIATGIGFTLNAAASMLSYKRLMQKGENVYFFNLVSFTLAWICLCLLNFAKENYINKYAGQMAIVITQLFLNFYYGCSATTTGRLLLFTLVPSHSSSSCEGVRTALSRIMVGVAFYIAAVIYFLLKCFISPLLLFFCWWWSPFVS